MYCGIFCAEDGRIDYAGKYLSPCKMSNVEDKSPPFCTLHVSTIAEDQSVPRLEFCVAAKGNLHYEENFGA